MTRSSTTGILCFPFLSMNYTFCSPIIGKTYRKSLIIYRQRTFNDDLSYLKTFKSLFSYDTVCHSSLLLITIMLYSRFFCFLLIYLRFIIDLLSWKRLWFYYDFISSYFCYPLSSERYFFILLSGRLSVCMKPQSLFNLYVYINNLQ